MSILMGAILEYSTMMTAFSSKQTQNELTRLKEFNTYYESIEIQR